MVKSFGFYCLRYVGFLVLALILVAAAVYGLHAIAPDLAADLFDGNTSMGIVSAIIPTMLVAQQFYKYEQRRMTAGEGWSMAVVFAILAFLVSGVVIWVGFRLALLSDAELRDVSMLWNGERQILLTVFAIFAVFLVLINKLMLWSGVRGAIKGAERLAAKSARKG